MNTDNNDVTAMVLSNDSFGGLVTNIGDTNLLDSLSTGKGTFHYDTSYWPSTTCLHSNHCYHKDQNATEQAYKIVRALMEAKIVQVKSMKKFFELMDEVKKAI